MSFFHIFNRGVDKRSIFESDADRTRFLNTSWLSSLKNAPRASLYFRKMKLGLIPNGFDLEGEFGPAIVEIMAYCLMPNHYHFLIKEKDDKAVVKFMQRLGNGYTRYYNTKHKREGRLFTTQYKSVQVESDEHLMQVSRYIHLNPYMSTYVKTPLDQLANYPWSSLHAYTNQASDFCNPNEVLGLFRSREDYWDFVHDGAREMDQILTAMPHDIFIDPVDE